MTIDVFRCGDFTTDGATLHIRNFTQLVVWEYPSARLSFSWCCNLWLVHFNWFSKMQKLPSYTHLSSPYCNRGVIHLFMSRVMTNWFMEKWKRACWVKLSSFRYRNPSVCKTRQLVVLINGLASYLSIIVCVMFWRRSLFSWKWSSYEVYRALMKFTVGFAHLMPVLRISASDVALVIWHRNRIENRAEQIETAKLPRIYRHCNKIVHILSFESYTNKLMSDGFCWLLLWIWFVQACAGGLWLYGGISFPESDSCAVWMFYSQVTCGFGSD